MDKLIRLVGGVGSCIVNAASPDDGKGLRTFKMNAYNGGQMNVNNFFLPIVVDLAGIKVTAKQRPILLNHDERTPIGHSQGVNGGNGVENTGKKINIEGVFSFDNENTREIQVSSDNGFKWQASIGAKVTRVVRVAEGEKAEANGRTFVGPILIARQSVLQESSFVPLGADDSTSVKVAANATQENEEESYMDPKFEAWLKAKNHDVNKISDEVVAALKPIYEAEIKASAKPVIAPVKEPVIEPGVDLKASAATEIDDYKKQLMKASMEANQINVLCAGHPKIQAEAIENQWSPETVKDKVDLADLRARSSGDSFNIGSGKDNTVNAQEMEVAILQSHGYDGKLLSKGYSEKVLEASESKFNGQLGLQELMIYAAKHNGYSGSLTFGRDRESIHNFACGLEGRSLQASSSFSTVSLPGILNNVANKFLAFGFNDVENSWRSVSSIRNVKDFKQVSSYSLGGDLEYRKLNASGEIEHGTLSETAYTNQIDTFARMISLTRKDMINDDLGAFTDMLFKIGRGGALKLNKVFWTEFLDNASFFSVGNDNLETGALSIDVLSNMVTALEIQTDPDDNPMALTPSILLTPPQLKTLNRQLNNDTKIVSGSGTAALDGNPHVGLYTPVTSTYLQDATIANSSSTAAYLLTNPMSSSTIETAFLNGKQTPTVESEPAAFNRLGVQMRGFHDFGVNKQEFRSGVKTTGV